MRFSLPSCVITIMLLSACSTTPNDLVATAASSKTFSMSENYQEVYRRLYDVMKPCYSSPGYGGVSMEVEGQIYSELGYGQITFAQNNLLRNYYAVVKIEKTSKGSRVNLSTGNTIQHSRVANDLEKIAKGEKTSC